MYSVISQKRFHKVADVVQGGNDCQSSPHEVVVEGRTVTTDNLIPVVIAEHAMEVATDPEKVSAYALNSYAHGMSSASVDGGGMGRFPNFLLLSTKGGTCCDVGVECLALYSIGWHT